VPIHEHQEQQHAVVLVSVSPFPCSFLQREHPEVASSAVNMATGVAGADDLGSGPGGADAHGAGTGDVGTSAELQQSLAAVEAVGAICRD
jgi:hypothetical protein